jgi:hypothetical protein
MVFSQDSLAETNTKASVRVKDPFMVVGFT